MGFSFVHEGITRRARARLTRRMAALVALSAFLLLAGAGCGTDRSAKTSSGKEKGGDVTATKTTSAGAAGKTTRVSRAKAAKPRAGSGASPSAVRTNYVRLNLKGCVEFDPQWAAIRLGQSLTWHNESGSAVTIHMPTGPFDRQEFVVRAGQNAITGPARRAGYFSVWTEPSACRGIPRGAQGASPGVTVEGSQ